MGGGFFRSGVLHDYLQPEVGPALPSPAQHPSLNTLTYTNSAQASSEMVHGHEQVGEMENYATNYLVPISEKDHKHYGNYFKFIM
jgi:hypothetical protein